MQTVILRILAIILILLALADSARFLVIDEPRKSDVIVVLAGETDKRPAGGLNLLRNGFAKRLILDVPADANVFQWSEIELAQRYIATLPEAHDITVCPIFGLSTKDEAQDVSRCLKEFTPQKVLLLTSDYHTRRALATFKKRIPGYDYSIAAVYNPQQFGMRWWQHREWAKTLVNEWVRLAWWQSVDRWR